MEGLVTSAHHIIEACAVVERNGGTVLRYCDRILEIVGIDVLRKENALIVFGIVVNHLRASVGIDKRYRIVNRKAGEIRGLG